MGITWELNATCLFTMVAGSLLFLGTWEAPQAANQSTQANKITDNIRSFLWESSRFAGRGLPVWMPTVSWSTRAVVGLPKTNGRFR